eukprot:522421-Amphidinium_carterae.1
MLDGPPAMLLQEDFGMKLALPMSLNTMVAVGGARIRPATSIIFSTSVRPGMRPGEKQALR